MDTRPYFAKRNDMMVNILKNMRKEIAAAKQNEDHKDLNHLSTSFTKLWEVVWSNSQVTLETTKEMARLYTIGGTHWFVKMLILKLNSQVYSEDVSKCGDMIFSMMHIDLPACTLSLLINTIPAILTGDGDMESLCYPAGAALARLTVHCLAATIKMKTSGPYTTKKRKFRSVELTDLCNHAFNPVKQQKLSLSEKVGSSGDGTQEQLIAQAHNSLFQLFNKICVDSSKNPKLEFVYSFLEQCIELEGDDCGSLVSPLPPSLIYHLIRMQPTRFTPHCLLRIFDTGNPQSRRSLLEALCLLRNMPSA